MELHRFVCMSRCNHTTNHHTDDKDVDPCDVFTASALPCPANIAVGHTGVVDYMSVGSLLQAAGMNSLDEPAGIVGAGTSARESGILVLVTLTYSNYYLSSGTGSAALPGTGEETAGLACVAMTAGVRAMQGLFRCDVPRQWKCTLSEFDVVHMYVFSAHSRRMELQGYSVCLRN